MEPLWGEAADVDVAVEMASPALVSVLDDRRSIAILRVLEEQVRAISLDDLTIAIQERLGDEDIAELESFQGMIHHMVLPRMHKAGVVEYRHTSTVVGKGADFEDAVEMVDSYMAF